MAIFSTPTGLRPAPSRHSANQSAVFLPKHKKTTASVKNSMAFLTKKATLDIPLNQKIAFGLSMATLASCVLPLPPEAVKILGLAFQVASGFSIIQNSFKAPYIQTACSLASLGLTFTPLKPLIQGISTYGMCYDSYTQTQKSLKLRNGKNDWTVGRNLLVYSTNAFHSCYNFSKLFQSEKPQTHPEPESPLPKDTSIADYKALFTSKKEPTSHSDSGLVSPLPKDTSIAHYKALFTSKKETPSHSDSGLVSPLPKDTSIADYKALSSSAPSSEKIELTCLKSDKNTENLISAFIEGFHDTNKKTIQNYISKIKSYSDQNSLDKISKLHQELSSMIASVLTKEFDEFKKTHSNANPDEKSVRRIVFGIFAPELARLKEQGPKAMPLYEAMNTASHSTSEDVVKLMKNEKK